MQSQLLALFAVGAVSYVFSVRRNRYQRIKRCVQKLGCEGLSEEEILEKISTEDAREITVQMDHLEFPLVYHLALQFALFRTYGIPSISRILKKTMQLAEPENAGRRYMDTTALIAEFCAGPLDSPRPALALERMNYLHSLHPDILPRDTLYTLLLFAVQPILFIRRLEWRDPTPLELAASCKFWTEVGLRMKIPRESIPTTLAEMEKASEKVEEEYMIFAESNSYVASRTMDLLIYYVPMDAGKWVARQIIYALLDERLRISMGFPDAPAWAKIATSIGVSTRRFVLQHLSLPRITRVRRVGEPDANGKYHMLVYDNEPWYVEGTLWNRWGPWAIVQRLGGWPVPGGPEFRDDGYRIESLGPPSLEKAGIDKVRAAATKRSGCPYP